MKKLGFGLMRLPLLDREDSSSVNLGLLNEMVDCFIGNGFNYFDTAYTYLNGFSEKSFKKSVADRYPRNSYRIADKLPIFNLENESQMEEIFNRQLERCGVDYFDCYLLHNVSSKHVEKFTKIDSFGFVEAKKKEGKIKHIGISSHDSPEFLDDILARHPEIEFVQLQINYLDWEDNVIQARGCYDVATSHNKPVIVMEPLKGGALANLPADVEALFENYDGNLSSASWSLRYLLSLGNVCMILSGMNSISQLEDNISTADNFKPLDDTEHGIINDAIIKINNSISIKCTSCMYCVDECVQNINIPKYFNLYNAQKLLDQEHSIGMYYRNYASGSKHASPTECIECNKCLDCCPQHLDIPRLLKIVADEFE